MSTVLTCESCGGPLAYGAPSCAYCRAPQTWERLVSIERGSPFVDNEVELRFADSVFQIVCNGHRVSTLVDASFGFGMLGWIGGSVGGPARTLLRTASAWQAR